MQLFDSIFFISLLSLQARARSVSEYMEHRNRILELEDAIYLGSDLTLTPEEIFANNFLMTYKVKHKNITLEKNCGSTNTQINRLMGDRESDGET